MHVDLLDSSGKNLGYVEGDVAHVTANQPKIATLSVGPENGSVSGGVPEGGWEKVRDYYFSLGVIKEKLPPSDYYVTDAAFYKEANNFDKDKIIAMARAYNNTCKDAK